MELIFSSFVSFLSWPVPLYLVAGSLLGLVFGVLPGLGGAQVVALLTPLTLVLDANSAMAMLIGAGGAVPFGGSISAILINTPGTGMNAATVFDGFPMAQQGRASAALAASATASALGGVIGALVLSFIMPLGKSIVLSFSYPEFFMLALMGISMISVTSPGALWKGLAAGGIGLLLTMVGYDPATGAIRYTFGIRYLWDGIDKIPALIGMFAVAEGIDLMVGKESIALERYKVSRHGVIEGILSIFKHFRIFLQSSIIGTIIGIIPGVGGSVANFLSYFYAKQTAKDPEKFGTGDIRGVIAAEASNNAKEGGSLVPTLLFGIPGSIEMAVLVGALMLHDLEPGSRLLTEHPQVPYIMIYSLIIANLLVSGLGLLLANPLSKLTMVTPGLIAPLVFSVSLLGAYATKGEYADVILALIFGVLGFIMKRTGFSRINLIIALVLGALMQRSFFQTLQSLGWYGFFVRPIALILALIVIFSLISPYLRKKAPGRVAKCG